jgi:hypothetical protein
MTHPLFADFYRQPETGQAGGIRFLLAGADAGASIKRLIYRNRVPFYNSISFQLQSLCHDREFNKNDLMLESCTNSPHRSLPSSFLCMKIHAIKPCKYAAKLYFDNPYHHLYFLLHQDNKLILRI